MLYRPPQYHQRPPLIDRRDSEILAAEAEQRGETAAAGTGADIRLARYQNMQARQMQANLAGHTLPAPGEVLFLISQRDVNAFTLILWALQQVGGKAESLFVTTFNLNREIIDAFVRLLDDESVGSLSIVLSQSIESRMPDRVAQLHAHWLGRPRMQDRFRVSLCWNHSKVALLAAGHHRIVITGSGNYSFNAEIEQYEVWNDPALFAFMQETLNRRCFLEPRRNKRHKIWGQP
jgi:hypothetical protein